MSLLNLSESDRLYCVLTTTKFTIRHESPNRSKKYSFSLGGGESVRVWMSSFPGSELTMKIFQDIKVELTCDDYGSMLIDGGLPQRNAALKALEDSGVQGITIATLAKRMEEIFVTSSDYPVILPRTSEELFLLQRIRDEAHRFAITAQRASRSKSISSTLLEIPGLGEAKARLLLRKFGSLKRIKIATVEEISSLPGFGPKLAEQIKALLTD